MLKNGLTYIIASHSEGLVYKRIKKKSPTSLLLISDNEEYPTQEMEITDVQEIWRAIGVISFNNSILDRRQV